MKLSNILQLGIKELRTLWRDPVMLVLIVYTFTASVYTSAASVPETLSKAAFAIVDDDRSPLSLRISNAFYPPYFIEPARVSPAEADAGMENGHYTFVLNIPPYFQLSLIHI